MPAAVLLLLGLLLMFIIAGVVWRISSRRSSLPCPSWLSWLVEMENPLQRNYNASSIIQQLEIQPGMKVLDAGCGPGRVSIPLAIAVGSHGAVVAMDMQRRMLDRAREKAKAVGLTNIDFRETAIEASGLGTGEIDRAVLATVLGEIPDRQAALREIHRALKAGGILAISEIVLDPHYQSRSTILKLASQTGFHEKEFKGNRFSFTLLLEKG